MPKFKITLTVLALMVCAVFMPVASAQQNSTASYNSNRFLLFSGSFVVEGSGKTFQGVFKLDTFTGQTWFLKVFMTNNKVYRCWVLIQDSKELIKATKIMPSGDLRTEDQ